MQSRHADIRSPLSHAVMPQPCRVCPGLRRVRCIGHIRSNSKNKFAGRTTTGNCGIRQRLRCLRLHAMTQSFGEDSSVENVQGCISSSTGVGQGDLLIHLSGQSNLDLQEEGAISKQLDISQLQTQTQTLPQLDQIQILNTQDAILQKSSDFESAQNQQQQQSADNFCEHNQISQFPDYLEQVGADPSSLLSQSQNLNEQNMQQSTIEAQTLLTDLIEQNPQSSTNEAQTLFSDLIEQNPEQNTNETQSIQGLNLNNTTTQQSDFVQSTEETDQNQPLGDSQLLSEFIDKDPTYVAPDYVEQLDSESSVQKQQEDLKLVKLSQQEDDKKKQQQSQLGRVIALAIPALGFVLADPLMSLVDTGCVGQISAVQLAALGPNTAIFNLVFQVFQFLGSTTSNILAQNSVIADGISEHQRTERRNRGEQLMAYAMVSAGIFGIAVTLALEIFGKQLLSAVGASPQIMEPALAYLRVRALATPAVLISNVATGSCMGQQDSVTPMLVFAFSGIVNLVLDMHLILNMGMGVTGAALATTVAQYIGMVFFIWYLRRKGQPQKQNSGRKQGIPLKWHGLPKLEALKPFQEVAQTLLLRTVFTMLAFTAVSVSASTLGTVSIAAHQVALQVFWFLSFVPEPLSVTAQSLIATDSTNVHKMKSMASTILKMGCMAGALMGVCMAGILIGLPWLFTSDAAIKAAIGPLAPAAIVSIVTCTVVMMLDGICIGSNDSKHLRQTNFTALVVTLAMLTHGVHNGCSLLNVWWCLATFFQARLVLHIWHMMTHWKQTAFGRCEKAQTALVVA